VLAPDKFLRIAEEAGLMVPITRWIHPAGDQAGGRMVAAPAGQSEVLISITCPRQACAIPGLADYLGALCRETQLPPSLIKFELTEAALISNVGAARETLERLHAMGIQLMLDDFGRATRP